MAATVAPKDEVVKVTLKHLNTTVDSKNVNKFTEKIVHYADGRVKKTILIKQTPMTP